MSANGQKTNTGFKTIVRKDYENQKTPAFAFKRLRFLHEAVGGESGFNLSALTLPTLTTGFTNPSVSDLAGAKLLFNKSNLSLRTSQKASLLQDIDYKVTSNDRIEFIGFTADVGEIFEGVIENKASTGFQVIDGSSINASGTLTATNVDFNVGAAFTTNENPTEQVGAVTVFLDGVLQFRNSSNATASPSADGNYQEVDGGAGLAQIIRFNEADPNNDRDVQILSTKGWAERPSDSQRQLIESQQTTIDNLVETTALLAGVPETNFQGAPTQPDLKQFGDRVLTLEQTKNTTQKKRLTSPVGETGVMTDLSYTLTTGNYYRINFQLRGDLIGASTAIVVEVQDNGTTIGYVREETDSASTSFSSGHSWTHKMVGTALTFNVTFVSAGGSGISGNSTDAETYVTVEELSNHVEGTVS